MGQRLLPLSILINKIEVPVSLSGSISETAVKLLKNSFLTVSESYWFVNKCTKKNLVRLWKIVFRPFGAWAR